MGFDHSSDLELPTKDGMFLRDALEGTFTDVDDSNHTVQVIFPHDTVDTYRTTFDKDCFRESFKARLPLMCWQHDLRDPIGHALSAQVTPRHNELVGQFSAFDAVPNSKRAFSQIQDGTITDTSFGFRNPKYEQHSHHRGVKNVRSALMMEFSPVSIGSIPGAIATGLREEEFMSEHSATEIIGLVQAKLISEEEGKRMLAEMPEYREHITIVSPESERIRELEQRLAQRDTGGADAPTAEVTRIAELEAQVRELRGESLNDTPEQLRIRELEDQLREAGVDVGGDDTREDEWAPPAIPDVVTASDLFGALHPDWQAAIAGVRIAIAAPGEEFDGTRSDMDENVASIAASIQAAHAMAADWLKDVDVRSLPDEVGQALDLFEAAGTATASMLEVMGVEERASHEPVTPMDSENMAPTKVKCLTCGGSGESEDGKTCPTCMGSGVVALTRDDIPDDAPDNAVTCPKCKGKGTIMKGHMKCPGCKGKGWITKAQVDDMDTRADVASWSDKPWSDFKQSDYSPEEWKRACLIVRGDGSTKDMCSLPVREPDGTYNRHAIAAAAARLNQVDAAGDEKADAAGDLADLYRQMKEDLPPEVEKLLQRDDQEEAETRTVEELEAIRQASLDRLSKRAPASV